MVAERREEIPLSKFFEPVLSYQTGVYVTVLNIIQCIALAFLINEVRVMASEKELTSACILRSLVALSIIMVVWHRYVSEVQYLWPITFWDTIGPFSVGIFECAVVFSIRPDTTPLSRFVASIIAVQFLVCFAYWYGYWVRSLEITERLYKNFYAEYPQFTLHLTDFLKRHDKGNFLWLLLAIGLSFVFLALTTWLPRRSYEIIFPVIYLLGAIQGEFFGNFQKAMRKDKSLGPYLQ